MKTQIMLFANLCFVVTMFVLLSNSVEGGDNVRCKENERRALLEFKAGIVDDRGMLSSWGDDSNECCNWRGIRCSNLTGHVTLLNLPYIYHLNTSTWLWGKVSPSLSELKHLKYLNLSGNALYGEIPPQLGNLTNLCYLNLRYNSWLTVQNLDWVSRFHLLTHLDLSFVNLSSCNGWLNQIYRLSSLNHLHLSHCTLPDQFGPLINTSFPANYNFLVVADLSWNYFRSPKSYNWLFNFTTTLVSLDLSGNSFRSEIREAIGRIISLQSLSLSGCELEGMIPDSFMNLTRLATLDLSGNSLNGSLPNYFPRFPSLRIIWISNNKLSGTFPNNFWQLSSSLVNLDLSYNQITGQLNLTLFSSLEALYLRNNKLEGTIPETYLSNLSKLVALDLSFNSLSLKFSVYWVPPFQLDILFLQNCTLGPHFPNWLQSQHNISILAISSAGISDTIPLWFWALLPRVSYLNISHNNIRGTLPDLSIMSLSNDFDSEVIDMSYNNLTGPIPKLPVNIVALDLSQNMFTGSLSFLCTTSYENILSIRLSDNRLSGELPDCWINVHKLRELNLANNCLSGKLPASIGLLNEVKILQLRSNSLSGELPSLLMNCSELLLLDLSENEFSGEVPTWIGTHLTNLTVFSLGKNKFF
jgi:hypothetical protein